MEHHSFIQFYQFVPKNINAKVLFLHPSSQFLNTPATHQSFNKTSLSTDTFSWNSVLQAHLAAVEPHLAVLAYRDMLIAGVLPDRHSLPRALAASRLSSAFLTGLQIHSHALKLSLFRDSYVLLALMELYAHLGGADAASSVLSYSRPQTCVAYTVLSKFYLMENNPNLALEVFYHLAASAIELDHIAVATALKACRYSKSLRDGKKVHVIARETNLHCNVLVANSLLKMYIECGSIEESRALFDSMQFKDAVSWTTMINSYVQVGCFNEGLKLFREMVVHGVKPDKFAVCAVLPACTRMAARKHGTEVHGFIIRQHIELSTEVHNTLIDMHAKSGSLEMASTVFDKMPERDVVSWTVMILAYSLHGQGEIGIALFYRFIEVAGVEPDSATFTAALHACSVSRLIDEGERVFKMIGLDKLVPEHLVLMVMIHAQSGRFVQAWNFLEQHCMERNPNALRVILDGYRIYSNARMGSRVIEQLIELNPLIAENYVLKSNMYAASRKWDMFKEARQMMFDMGLKPKKAWSWIEVRCKVHTFCTGDVSHPRSERIYLELKGLMKRMEQEGYEPVEDFSMHDVDEEMECVHSGHSEMLAIAFGLISTQAGFIIRVTKNMRVCRNCHESARLISKIAGREILLKDREKFHRFFDGSCSCQGFW